MQLQITSVAQRIKMKTWVDWQQRFRLVQITLEMLLVWFCGELIFDLSAKQV